MELNTFIAGVKKSLEPNYLYSQPCSAIIKGADGNIQCSIEVVTPKTISSAPTDAITYDELSERLPTITGEWSEYVDGAMRALFDEYGIKTTDVYCCGDDDSALIVHNRAVFVVLAGNRHES